MPMIWKRETTPGRRCTDKDVTIGRYDQDPWSSKAAV